MAVLVPALMYLKMTKIKDIASNLDQVVLNPNAQQVTQEEND